MPDEQKIGDPVEKLYKTLSSKGYYTKSLGEFKTQYNTPETIDKIYGIVNRDGLYTKTKEEFYTQYFPEASKKKESPSFNISGIASGLGAAGEEAQNDPLKYQLNPIRNKLSEIQKRNVSESTQTPSNKFSQSNEASQLLNQKRELENLRFGNSQEAELWAEKKLDPSKLIPKGQMDMTKQPTLDDFTEESIWEATNKDNETDVKATSQYLDNRNVREVVSDSPTLADAAVKLAIKKNGLAGKQAQQLSGNIPRAMKANMLVDFLNNHDLQELAQNDGQLSSKIQEEIYNLPSHFPEAGVRLLAQAISDYRENEGYNNGILNAPRQSVNDDIVNKLIESGAMPIQYKNLYEQPGMKFWVNKQLRTPGFIENFGQGLSSGIMGIGKSVSELTGVRSLYKSKDQQLYEALADEYESVAFTPKGLGHKLSMHGGNVVGQVLPTALGGNAMIASKLVTNPRIANSIMIGLQSYGYNKERALKDLPGASEGEQLAYALTNTGIEIITENIVNDTKLARQLVGKAAPEVKKVIQKFTSKEISEEAARNQMNNIYSGAIERAKNFVKGYAKVTIGEPNEEILSNVGQNLNNQLFGGEKMSFKQMADEAFDVWKTTLMGSALLGGAGGIVQARRNPVTTDLVYEMASNPDYYKEMMQDQPNKIKNLEYAVSVKQSLDERQDLKEDQKKKLLIASLNEKLLKDKADSIPDATLKQDDEKKIKEIQIEKEHILNPDMSNTKLVEEFYNEELLPKGSMMLLEVEGKFNESKVGEYLKFIAQQANNLDENWQPHEGKAPTLQVPETIIEIANERWKKEIDKANPPIDQERDLDMGTEPLKEPSPEVIEEVVPIQENLGGSGKVVTLGESGKEAQNITSKEAESTENSTQPSIEESPEQLSKRYKRVTDENDFVDPYDVAVKYFADGGRINPSELERIFGGKGDKGARISLMKNNAGTVKQIAHRLWEADQTGKYEDTHYIDAVESALRDFPSKSAMQKDLADRYDLQGGYEKYLTQSQGKEAIDIVERMTEEEMNAILQMESDQTTAEKVGEYLDSLIQQKNETSISSTEAKPKEGFTEGSELNEILKKVKEKYGDKKGGQYYEAANRLVNPNKNTIVEIRSNGVVVYEGSKYQFKPFTNTDANYKKWELGRSIDVTNQFQKAETNEQATNPKTEAKDKQSNISTEKESSVGEVLNEAGEGTTGGKPPGEPPKVEGKDEMGGEDRLDKLANNVPDSGKVSEYMSKDTIEKYTGEEPTNDQRRGVQELEIALNHGEKIIEEAQRVFGNDYVEKTLDYINRSKAGVSNKALMYVSLENALGKEKLLNPTREAELTKQQALVYAESQKFARENSLALNYQKLRRVAKVGYDIDKVTDNFFSAEELVGKQDIKKAVEADADAINEAAEKMEVGGMTPEIEKAIEAGVEKEVAKIYEAMPKSRQSATDKAIRALEQVQKKLRSRTYDAGLGIPVAIIDAGISTIKLAIKAGVKIADAVELGIKKIKEKYGKEWKNEDKFRTDMLGEFEKVMSVDTKKLVKDALIAKGFGREITVKGEKKQILDWKKLAGSAGTVSKISENVADILKDKYSAKEIEAIKEELIQEYIDVRTGVIEKAQNELAKRNKETVSPEQKSAAKKLAELYTYGLFEKEADAFENTLNKALGAKVSEQGFAEAKSIAKALENIYKSTFKGVRLNDVSAKSAIEKLEDQLRVLLFRESKSQGNGNLKVANLVRSFFDTSQTMLLNNMKQAVENPFSGLFQNAMDAMQGMVDGTSNKALRAQQREAMKNIYKDMVLNGGITYGKVESQFVNRQHLDDYVNKLSDNKLYHSIASVATGKATLNAMDAMFKASITEKKFTSNLIRILTHETNPNKMGKKEALEFVTEKLTGQTYQDAKKTAKETIEKINEDAGKELIGVGETQISRLANDIVKASLEMGGKITTEQIQAAYNAAYKSAGLNLGHEANNMLSATVKGYSAKLEGDISRALKEKEWNRATFLIYKSILFRNILNPFVGGGTNWLVLKLEKTGLGLFTGLAYKVGAKSDIDLSTKVGLSRMEARLYNQARYKDSFTRGVVGGITSLTAFGLYKGLTGGDDEERYRKWRQENRWAARYLDVFTPEMQLAEMGVRDDKFRQYVERSFNRGDAFSSVPKLIKGVVYFSKGESSKGWGAMGEAVGVHLNAPLPWRLVKDLQVIYQGVTGQDPYHGNYQPSEGFLSGVLQGGIIEWLGGRPLPNPEWNSAERPKAERPKREKMRAE